MSKIVCFQKKTDLSLGILTSLYITSLLANLAIGYRYISFFRIDTAGGIFIFPLSFIIGDVISEVYDSKYAKNLILIGFVCQFIFSLYISLMIRMPTPHFWQHDKIYFQVMDPYLRFTIASGVSVIFGSWLNIYFLSKWSDLVHGRFFVLRSLGSSFIGELFITVFSMLVANYGKMESKQLVYMIVCCFSVKTLVSLVAVWPAALAVIILKEEWPANNKVSLFRKIKYALKNISKPVYRLDLINMKSKKANIYCHGARVTIKQRISEIILNPKIIHNMDPLHSGYIGYYFALLYNSTDCDLTILLNKYDKTNRYFWIKSNKYSISSLSRDGKINYIKKIAPNDIISQNPIEIYRNAELLENFTSSQACYIGLLAGIQHKKSRRPCTVPQKLKLVSKLRLVQN